MQINYCGQGHRLILLMACLLTAFSVELQADGALDKIRKNLDAVSEDLGKARGEVDDARQNLDRNVYEVDSLVNEAESIKREAETLIEELQDHETQKAIAAKTLKKSLGGSSRNNAPLSVEESNILASTLNGDLTEDAVNAYTEALQFCLQQIGRGVEFSAQDRNEVQKALTQAYTTLDASTQRKLADARNIYNHHRSQWRMLSLQDKQAYAYDVLSLAYGEDAAAQALGINQGTGAYTRD